MRIKKTGIQFLVLFLAGDLFAANTVFAYSAETNFWKERSRGISGESKTYAALPGEFTPGIGAVRVDESLLRLRSPLSSPALTSSVKSQPQLISFLSSIPASCGTIRKISAPLARPSQGIILQIQDVHRNPEAQSNIETAVRSLAGRVKVNLIALEGAWGKIGVSGFQNFSHREAVRMASDFLLKEKKISGPLHAALTAGPDFPELIGVDDEIHYRRNVAAYQKSSPIAARIKAQLDRMTTSLRHKKAAVFNPALARLDAIIEAHRSSRMNLAEYLSSLGRISSASGVAMKSLVLESYLAAADLENHIDFVRVERERNEAIQKLVGKMSQPEADELLQFSILYRSGELGHGEYYSHLKSLCLKKGIALESSPALNDYIQYVLLSESIDAEKLERDVNQLETALTAKLTRTPEEKELLQSLQYLNLAGKLVDFSLSKEEWKEYQEIANCRLTKATEVGTQTALNASARFIKCLLRNCTPRNMFQVAPTQPSPCGEGLTVMGGDHSKFGRKPPFLIKPSPQGEGWVGGRDAFVFKERLPIPVSFLPIPTVSSPGKLPDFRTTQEESAEEDLRGNDGGLTSFEKFYEAADARDQLMADSFLKAVEGKVQPVSILVAGGYHSSGLTRRLNEAGYTTVTFVPRLTKIQDETGSSYLSVFTQEKTSLEKLVAGEKLFLAPQQFPPAGAIEAAQATLAANRRLVPDVTGANEAQLSAKLLAPATPEPVLIQTELDADGSVDAAAQVKGEIIRDHFSFGPAGAGRLDITSETEIPNRSLLTHLKYLRPVQLLVHEIRAWAQALFSMCEYVFSAFAALSKWTKIRGIPPHASQLGMTQESEFSDGNHHSIISSFPLEGKFSNLEPSPLGLTMTHKPEFLNGKHPLKTSSLPREGKGQGWGQAEHRPRRTPASVVPPPLAPPLLRRGGELFLGGWSVDKIPLVGNGQSLTEGEAERGLNLKIGKEINFFRSVVHIVRAFFSSWRWPFVSREIVFAGTGISLKIPSWIGFQNQNGFNMTADSTNGSPAADNSIVWPNFQTSDPGLTDEDITAGIRRSVKSGCAVRIPHFVLADYSQLFFRGAPESRSAARFLEGLLPESAARYERARVKLDSFLQKPKFMRPLVVRLNLIQGQFHSPMVDSLKDVDLVLVWQNENGPMDDDPLTDGRVLMHVCDGFDSSRPRPTLVLSLDALKALNDYQPAIEPFLALAFYRCFHQESEWSVRRRVSSVSKLNILWTLTRVSVAVTQAQLLSSRGDDPAAVKLLETLIDDSARFPEIARVKTRLNAGRVLIGLYRSEGQIAAADRFMGNLEQTYDPAVLEGCIGESLYYYQEVFGAYGAILLQLGRTNDVLDLLLTNRRDARLSISRRFEIKYKVSPRLVVLAASAWRKIYGKSKNWSEIKKGLGLLVENPEARDPMLKDGFTWPEDMEVASSLAASFYFDAGRWGQAIEFLAGSDGMVKPALESSNNGTMLAACYKDSGQPAEELAILLQTRNTYPNSGVEPLIDRNFGSLAQMLNCAIALIGIPSRRRMTLLILDEIIRLGHGDAFIAGSTVRMLRARVAEEIQNLGAAARPGAAPQAGAAPHNMLHHVTGSRHWAVIAGSVIMEGLAVALAVNTAHPVLAGLFIPLFAWLDADLAHLDGDPNFEKDSSEKMARAFQEAVILYLFYVPFVHTASPFFHLWFVPFLVHFLIDAIRIWRHGANGHLAPARAAGFNSGSSERETESAHPTMFAMKGGPDEGGDWTDPIVESVDDISSLEFLVDVCDLTPEKVQEKHRGLTRPHLEFWADHFREYFDRYVWKRKHKVKREIEEFRLFLIGEYPGNPPAAAFRRRLTGLKSDLIRARGARKEIIAERVIPGITDVSMIEDFLFLILEPDFNPGYNGQVTSARYYVTGFEDQLKAFEILLKTSSNLDLPKRPAASYEDSFQFKIRCIKTWFNEGNSFLLKKLQSRYEELKTPFLGIMSDEDFARVQEKLKGHDGLRAVERKIIDLTLRGRIAWPVAPVLLSESLGKKDQDWCRRLLVKAYLEARYYYGLDAGPMAVIDDFLSGDGRPKSLGRIVGQRGSDKLPIGEGMAGSILETAQKRFQENVPSGAVINAEELSQIKNVTFEKLPAWSERGETFIEWTYKKGRLIAAVKWDGTIPAAELVERILKANLPTPVKDPFISFARQKGMGPANMGSHSPLDSWDKFIPPLNPNYEYKVKFLTNVGRAGHGIEVYWAEHNPDDEDAVVVMQRNAGPRNLKNRVFLNWEFSPPDLRSMTVAGDFKSVPDNILYLLFGKKSWGFAGVPLEAAAIGASTLVLGWLITFGLILLFRAWHHQLMRRKGLENMTRGSPTWAELRDEFIAVAILSLYIPFTLCFSTNLWPLVFPLALQFWYDLESISSLEGLKLKWPFALREIALAGTGWSVKIPVWTGLWHESRIDVSASAVETQSAPVPDAVPVATGSQIDGDQQSQLENPRNLYRKTFAQLAATLGFPNTGEEFKQWIRQLFGRQPKAILRLMSPANGDFDQMESRLVELGKTDGVVAVEITEENMSRLPALLRLAASVEEKSEGRMSISVLRGFKRNAFEEQLKTAGSWEIADAGAGVNRLEAEVKKDRMMFFPENLSRAQARTAAIELAQIAEKIERPEPEVLSAAISARDRMVDNLDVFLSWVNSLPPDQRKRIAGIRLLNGSKYCLAWTWLPFLRRCRLAGLPVALDEASPFSSPDPLKAMKAVHESLATGTISRISGVDWLAVDPAAIPLPELQRISATDMREKILKEITSRRIHVEFSPLPSTGGQPPVLSRLLDKRDVMSNRTLNIAVSPNHLHNGSVSDLLLMLWQTNSRMLLGTFLSLFPQSLRGRFSVSDEKQSRDIMGRRYALFNLLDAGSGIVKDDGLEPALTGSLGQVDAKGVITLNFENYCLFVPLTGIGFKGYEAVVIRTQRVNGRLEMDINFSKGSRHFQRTYEVGSSFRSVKIREYDEERKKSEALPAGVSRRPLERNFWVLDDAPGLIPFAEFLQTEEEWKCLKIFNEKNAAGKNRFAGRILGTTDGNGRLNFNLNGVPFNWSVLSAPRKDVEVRIKRFHLDGIEFRNGTKNLRVTMDLQFLKNGRVVGGRRFFLVRKTGPNEVKDELSGTALWHISDNPGEDWLRLFVRKPSNLSWPDLVGALPVDVRFMKAGRLTSNGTVGIQVAANYRYNLFPFMEERDAPRNKKYWELFFDDVKIGGHGHPLIFFRLEKDGRQWREYFPRPFHVGLSTKAVPVYSTSEPKPPLPCWEMDKTPGMTFVYDVLTKKRETSWGELLKKYPFPIRGLPVGITNDAGLLTVTARTGQAFPWSVLGKKENGWAASIESFDPTNKPHLVLRLTNGEKILFRIFQIGPGKVKPGIMRIAPVRSIDLDEIDGLLRFLVGSGKLSQKREYRKWMAERDLTKALAGVGYDRYFAWVLLAVLSIKSERTRKRTYARVRSLLNKVAGIGWPRAALSELDRNLDHKNTDGGPDNQTKEFLPSDDFDFRGILPTLKPNDPLCPVWLKSACGVLRPTINDFKDFAWNESILEGLASLPAEVVSSHPLIMLLVAETLERFLGQLSLGSAVQSPEVVPSEEHRDERDAPLDRNPTSNRPNHIHFKKLADRANQFIDNFSLHPLFDRVRHRVSVKEAKNPPMASFPSSLIHAVLSSRWVYPRRVKWFGEEKTAAIVVHAGMASFVLEGIGLAILYKWFGNWDLVLGIFLLALLHLPFESAPAVRPQGERGSPLPSWPFRLLRHIGVFSLYPFSFYGFEHLAPSALSSLILIFPFAVHYCLDAAAILNWDGTLALQNPLIHFAPEGVTAGERVFPPAGILWEQGQEAPAGSSGGIPHDNSGSYAGAKAENKNGPTTRLPDKSGISSPPTGNLIRTMLNLVRVIYTRLLSQPRMNLVWNLADRDGVDVHNSPALNKWYLSWLNNPDYFAPQPLPQSYYQGNTNQTVIKSPHNMLANILGLKHPGVIAAGVLLEGVIMMAGVNHLHYLAVVPLVFVMAALDTLVANLTRPKNLRRGWPLSRHSFWEALLIYAYYVPFVHYSSPVLYFCFIPLLYQFKNDLFFFAASSSEWPELIGWTRNALITGLAALGLNFATPIVWALHGIYFLMAIPLVFFFTLITVAGALKFNQRKIPNPSDDDLQFDNSFEYSSGVNTHIAQEKIIAPDESPDLSYLYMRSESKHPIFKFSVTVVPSQGPPLVRQYQYSGGSWWARLSENAEWENARVQFSNDRSVLATDLKNWLEPLMQAGVRVQKISVSTSLESSRSHGIQYEKIPRVFVGSNESAQTPIDQNPDTLIDMNMGLAKRNRRSPLLAERYALKIDVDNYQHLELKGIQVEGGEQTGDDTGYFSSVAPLTMQWGRDSQNNLRLILLTEGISPAQLQVEERVLLRNNNLFTLSIPNEVFEAAGERTRKNVNRVIFHVLLRPASSGGLTFVPNLSWDIVPVPPKNTDLGDPSSPAQSTAQTSRPFYRRVLHWLFPRSLHRFISWLMVALWLGTGVGFSSGRPEAIVWNPERPAKPEPHLISTPFLPDDLGVATGEAGSADLTEAAASLVEMANRAARESESDPAEIINLVLKKSAPHLGVTGYGGNSPWNARFADPRFERTLKNFAPTHRRGKIAPWQAFALIGGLSGKGIVHRNLKSSWTKDVAGADLILALDERAESSRLFELLNHSRAANSITLFVDASRVEAIQASLQNFSWNRPISVHPNRHLVKGKRFLLSELPGLLPVDLHDNGDNLRLALSETYQLDSQGWESIPGFKNLQVMLIDQFLSNYILSPIADFSIIQRFAVDLLTDQHA